MPCNAKGGAFLFATPSKKYWHSATKVGSKASVSTAFQKSYPRRLAATHQRNENKDGYRSG
jgi:hypothetical protein